MFQIILYIPFAAAEGAGALACGILAVSFSAAALVLLALCFKAENRAKLKGYFILIAVVFAASFAAGVFFVFSPPMGAVTGAAAQIVGAAAMLIPGLPQWAGGIVCLLALAFGAVSVLKARAAAQIAGDRENQVGEQTYFIRGITAEAQILMGRASSPLIKEKCKKIYEALRYSDPVSVSALADTERSIREEFCAFSDAVSAADLGGAESACEALLALINERNAACRLLK